MAVNLPNFLGATKHTDRFREIGNLFGNILSGYEMSKRPEQMRQEAEKLKNENFVAQLKAQFLPKQLEQEEEGRGYENVLNALKAQFLPQEYQDESAYKQSLINKNNAMTPLEAEELRLKNQYYPEITESEIKSRNALANNRALGIGTLGAGGREELFFQDTVQKDNPHLTPEQVYEAANVLRAGGNVLSDGTYLNEMSPAARASADRLAKYSSTSPLLTGAVRGAQSEAEIQELSKYAQEGLKPYGDTYAGYSPAQIIDSFKTDDESQKRLGKFIGSQQLQFEIAQNQINLANGKPGVTTTQELMELGMQRINAKYPRLSQKARKEAQDYFIEALKKGFEARMKVPMNASQAGQSGPNNKSKRLAEIDKMDKEIAAIDAQLGGS